MRVIVTRDAFGVQIWEENADIVYKAPFGKKGVKVWMSEKIFKTGLIFSDKKVRKYFPGLFKELYEGDKVVYDLNFRK